MAESRPLTPHATSGVANQNESMYTCVKCQRQYLHKGTLKRHQMYECGKDPSFSCLYCDHKCKQKSNLIQHMAQRHADQFIFTKNNSFI
ncbi:longitudinals lacking protein-like [Nilaparvata lugens]|uniref:longitudinals lacking protein-like n=1 Tax=Nilaparvata lugens TaxID=108931 RepID=UPI00193D9C05|nr:longitudinals lacking protein-like [Nilaparvata lugens]